MTTIDLGTQPSSEGVFGDVPRRLTLTLAELRLVAERSADAPLPFDVAVTADASALESRLGQSRGSAAQEAYAAAVARLHDPEETLARRGLLVGGEVDPGLAGAIGLLATPRLALDIDVSVGGARARSWHRHRDGAVATLSTLDGLVLELAWFAVAAWAGELGRVAVLPEGQSSRASRVPALVELPYALVDAGLEAHRSGRPDLVPVLASTHEVRDADGAPMSPAEIDQVVGALANEAQGRLRVLAAEVHGTAPTAVGVVSWTLLADGWRALRPRTRADELWVMVEKVGAGDLSAELAPVVAEVSGPVIAGGVR